MEFYFRAAGFFRGFCCRSLSPHFCEKKCPVKSPRKILSKILQILYYKSPTPFCRGAGPKKSVIHCVSGIYWAKLGQKRCRTKSQKESLDVQPEFLSEKCSEFSLNFSRISVQKSPGKFEEEIHKSLLESRQRKGNILGGAFRFGQRNSRDLALGRSHKVSNQIALPLGSRLSFLATGPPDPRRVSEGSLKVSLKVSLKGSSSNPF